MLRFGRVCFALLTTLALWSGVALADESPGAIFKRAQAEYNAGRFEHAAELFEQADAISPTAQAAYNAGVAWDAAHQRSRAANALSQALDRGQLSTAEVEEASRRLAELAPSLGKLSLNAPEGAAVTAGKLEVSIPGTLYVEPGSHRLRARLKNGKVVERSLDVRAGQTLALAFEEKAKPEAAAEPVRAKSVAPEQDREPSGTSTGRVVGYGLLGVGAAALGAGIYVNLRGVSANQDFEDSGFKDADARQRAVDLRTGAMIAYGASAVLGGVGLVLVLTSKDGASTQASVGPGSVTVSGRF